MGWAIEMDIVHAGTSVTGTYYFRAVDGGPAPESWGLVTGSISTGGAVSLNLVARGPAGQISPNPGGTFSGTVSAARDQINGTLFRVHVSGLPGHDPQFNLVRRAPGQ
jgi:hypothetical protein